MASQFLRYEFQHHRIKMMPGLWPLNTVVFVWIEKRLKLFAGIDERILE